MANVSELLDRFVDLSRVGSGADASVFPRRRAGGREWI